jgi:dolichol kinase
MLIYQQILPELKRKLFHCIGLVFPLAYCFMDKISMVTMLFLAAVMVLYIDSIRHNNIQLQNIIKKFFHSIIREHEKSGTHNLSGISYFVSGLFLSCLLFPKSVAITSWAVLIVADSLAALTGKAIGKPYVGDKSIEGSIAFLVSTIMISIMMLGFTDYAATFISIVITSIIVTYVELYADRIGINDNFTIPISFGLSLIITNYLTS